MIDLEHFLDKFGIYEGITLVGYTLTDIQGDKKTIERYREYEYRIILTFEYIENTRPNPILLQLALNALPRDQIIKTEYNGRYQCHLSDFEIDYDALENTYVVNIFGFGHCYRI